MYDKGLVLSYILCRHLQSGIEGCKDNNNNGIQRFYIIGFYPKEIQISHQLNKEYLYYNKRVYT